MIRKLLALVFVATISLQAGPAFGNVDNDRDVAAIRTGIEKLGTGRDTHIDVRLTDGRRVKGYVDKIGDASFVVVNEKTGVATEIPYPSVKGAKGKKISGGAKAAIIVGAVVAGIVIVTLLLKGKD